ncbi:MAG: AsnC family transcriptional regulator [Acidobacteriales bacterium]|nr:AsnC family transcriptional regulator [Terriglobales bacterium]
MPNHHPSARKNFDEIDMLIIQSLQLDASQRLEDVAKLVKLAPSSVHERLRRLRRDGVIRRWTVAVDADALGLNVLAYIGVRATRPCSELLSSLEQIPEIEECHSVAGELSMLLKVRVASTNDLLGISEKLRQIAGIENTETTIVLKTQIERPVPLPLSTKSSSPKQRTRD